MTTKNPQGYDYNNLSKEIEDDVSSYIDEKLNDMTDGDYFKSLRERGYPVKFNPKKSNRLLDEQKEMEFIRDMVQVIMECVEYDEEYEE